MDKRTRLIQDLQRFSRNNSKESKESSDTQNIFDSSDEDLRLEEPILDSDDDLRLGGPAHSEFGDDTDSEGGDDLECHLPLLVPEELQDLGVNALRAGSHEAAVRYLNLAQLRLAESLGKRLAGGVAVQLDHEAIFQQWALSTYLQAAIERGPFVELPQMLRQYEAMLVEGTKQAQVSARATADLAQSELHNPFASGQS